MISQVSFDNWTSSISVEYQVQVFDPQPVIEGLNGVMAFTAND